MGMRLPTPKARGDSLSTGAACLTEERFRQEWVNFKADDQKRWTNYTLAQEEQQQIGRAHV